jgi:hypothetical protein
VTDESGATATSDPVSVVVNEPPTVSLTSPASGATFTAPATVALAANAADSDGTVARVDFFQGSTLLGSDTSSPYTWSWTNVPAGRYVASARAIDNRGAVTMSSAVTVVVTAALSPSADAYVRDGSSATTNFGGATTLVARRSTSSGNTRWTYLRFDTSAVATVQSAKLQLFGALSATTSTAVNAQAFPSAVTSWSESGITWNNKPALGATPLAAVPLVTGSTSSRWYEWDVTAYLQQEKAAGRPVVTLVVRNDVSTAPQVNFQSKEASSNRPTLLVVP